MDLAEALDIVGNGRFRELCDPDHPDYAPAYIALVMSLATGEPIPQPAAPAVEYRRGKRVVRLGMKIETRPP